MLRAISRRTQNDYSAQAAFHGIKIPYIRSLDPKTEEVDEEFDLDPEFEAKALRDAQQRVRARYG